MKRGGERWREVKRGGEHTTQRHSMRNGYTIVPGLLASISGVTSVVANLLRRSAHALRMRFRVSDESSPLSRSAFLMFFLWYREKGKG